VSNLGGVTNPILPLTEFHHPMTFGSRGVAMALTTPLLAGTRVREASPKGVELVVPNPSGARGVYVLNWPGVRALCTPTLHDTVLFQRISRLPTIDPAGVRGAALAVAAEGHAGRRAAAAAEVTIVQDRSRRVLAHFLLMLELVEQAGAGSLKTAPAAEQAAHLDHLATAVLHRIAPLLGRPAGYLAASLSAISDAFAPVGVAAADRDARIPRLLIRLEETHANLSAWLDQDAGNDIGGLGLAITAAMARAGDSTAAVLEKTRLTLTEPVVLLRQWITGPSVVAALAARCDWLLDGWERVCLLWLSADSTASRRAALLEMAPLLPVLPREVTAWSDVQIPAEAMKPACRVISRDDSWRIGSPAFAQIERNETLLAMSA
jgi:hypothetical protein